MKGLGQRLLTAIIFVAVMLGGLFGSLYSFLALFALIAILSLWEFSGIVLKKEENYLRRIYGVLIGIIPFIFMSLPRLGLTFPEWGGLVILVLLLSIFIHDLFRGPSHPFRNSGYLFSGAVYIGLPVSLLLSDTFLSVDNYDPHRVFVVLLLVWASDTGAYLIGSMIGKTPLAPVVSPKKTWEGTIGGWVFSVGVSIALYYVYGGELLEIWQFVILALICGVFGTLGDLIESKFKRSYNIKDSGNLLPGHGGMLDRFDAFLLVVPFAYVFLSLI